MKVKSHKGNRWNHLLRSLIAVMACCAVVLSVASPARAFDSADVEEQVKELKTIYQNENYSLLPMTQERWFKWMLTLSNAYDAFSLQNRSGTMRAYQSTMTRLLYPEGELLEAISEAEDGSPLVMAYNDVDDILTFSAEMTEGTPFQVIQLEEVEDLTGKLGRVGYVSEEVLKLLKITVGSDMVNRALKLAGEREWGLTHDAARELVQNEEDLSNGEAGRVILRKLLQEETITDGLWELAGEVSAISMWQQVVSGSKLLANAAFSCEKYMDAIVEYQNLADVQSMIWNTLSALKAADYDSEEAYLEDCRALAFTYVLCAYQGNALFADWQELDQDQWERVEQVFLGDLNRILSVGAQQE